jgi:hypothetical protein
MSVTILGESQLLFGIVDEKYRPKLPMGFHFVEHPDMWLMATDGEKFYYVEKSRLVLRGISTKEHEAATNGALKEGACYFDDREVIQL